jgi:uncharacterized membrane protein YfcA
VKHLPLLIWLRSLLTGVVEALTGLGGGVVLVPLLTLAFQEHAGGSWKAI